MKKVVLSLVLALLALGLFTGAASASQGNQPLREGRGLLHDYIVAAFAEEVGLTVDEVNAAVTAGKTLYQIALDEGIAEANIPALLKSVHETALAAAVADGVLTQAQADRMLARMAKQGYGSGTCTMGGTRPQDGTGFGSGRGIGMRGGGRGSQTNP